MDVAIDKEVEKIRKQTYFSLQLDLWHNLLVYLEQCGE